MSVAVAMSVPAMVPVLLASSLSSILRTGPAPVLYSRILLDIFPLLQDVPRVS